jgi:hypothetical protein
MVSIFDERARQLFQEENSPFARRDRREYMMFNNMPEGLKQWWRDRAARNDSLVQPSQKDRER